MGVVHRDMKPENILFDVRGTAKISDFGISHLPATAGGSEDAARVALGTPAYMAPEQHATPDRVDARSDLYAVGVLFHEMFCGGRLTDRPDVRVLIVSGETARIPQRLANASPPPALPDPLHPVLHKLLAISPAQRYASADDVLADLDRATGPTDRAGSPPHHTGAAMVTTAAETLQDIMELLLTDGVLGPDERRELQRRAERLGVDETLAVHLEEQVRARKGLPSYRAVTRYAEQVRTALRNTPDGDVPADGRASLRTLAQDLGISDTQAATIEMYCRCEPAAATPPPSPTDPQATRAG
jgi:hypothetical protein